MTTNQINYWKLKEEERANRANEGLKGQEVSISYFKAPFEAAEKFGSTVEHFGGAWEKTTKGFSNIGKLVSSLAGLFA